MKFVPVVFACLFGTLAWGQTREVDPADLTIQVTLETGDVAPFQQEMVLLTIHGVYRRHITREALEQPDLTGFNWMQLGEDHWYDSMLDGLKVKNFKRRMALFPERAGEITIKPFIHHLTLLDENNNWFVHDIMSEPVTLDVQPAPQDEDWWFPVRRLEIADNWSNAPDQLGAGEGVLRIIRIEAVGAAPDMIPPMPELRAPSALVFAHPEKRLVDLTPEGPSSIAFWRWTIKPTNGVSGVLEPMTFRYFDTTERKMQEATISAQRVAFREVDMAELPAPPGPGHLARAALGGVFGASALGGLAALVFGRRFDGWGQVLRRIGPLDPNRRALKRAARTGDLPALARAAHALEQDRPTDAERTAMLRDLEDAIYGRGAGAFDAEVFAAGFMERL